MLAGARLVEPILPMKFFLNLPLGRRLGAATALLLLLLGLSTALSLTRIRQLDQQVDQFELNTLPSVRLLHDLSAGVEDLRGMAALHLVLSGTAELPALESRMLGQRQRMDQRLAACARRLKTESDHRHNAAVRVSVDRFWAAQDQLMLLSRRAASDPAAAAAARVLLTGPAQQAYLQLGADLAAWWDDVEQRAGLAASQARSDAANTAAGLLALLAVGLLVVGAAVLWRSPPAALAQGPDAGTAPDAAPVYPLSAPSPGSPSPAERARLAIGRARADPAPPPTVHTGLADPPQTRSPDGEPVPRTEQAAADATADADATTPPARR